jgi:uncharacterized protein (TIGR02246 family)
VRKTISLVGLFVFAVLASACSQKVEAPPAPTPPDHRAADAAAIRALDAAWAKAAADKDPAKFASFYAPDATLLPPGGPMTTGKDAISEAWQHMVAQPGFSLTFAPTKVEVSKSGDMAYELGNYALTVNDKRGHPQTSKGKYVVVWGKQPGGTWKVLVDAPTTTQ